MRILHLLHRSIPGTHGYAVRSREIVNNQAAVGLEPMVITSPSQAAAGVLDNEKSEFIDGIRYFRTGADFLPPTIEVSDSNPVVSALRVAQNVSLLKRTVAVTKKYRPAILHSHSPFTCGLIGDLAGAWTRTPRIYEIRGLWEDSHTSRHGLSEKSFRYRSVRELETRAARAADAVCVISDALRTEMISRGIPEQKIFQVPNGVDVKRFQPGTPRFEIREQHNLVGKFVIGYIGSFFTYEGLDILMQAFLKLAPQISELALLLVGDGELAPKLKTMSEQGAVQDRVVFTGKVKHSEVDDYYRICDLMVLPRRDTRETRLVTPLKPMEIMAMEKPLIVSDIGGHHEIVIEGLNGIYFKAEDSDNLAEKCRLLIENQEERTKLAAQGRNWVIHNRDWAVLVRKYEEMYVHLQNKFRK